MGATADWTTPRPAVIFLVFLQEVAGPRTRLPNCRPLRRGFSIWSVLKNAIGRDLTRITMPATINEPLSALQVGREADRQTDSWTGGNLHSKLALLQPTVGCPCSLAMVVTWLETPLVAVHTCSLR
jgi:Oxysterol-binding protein